MEQVERDRTVWADEVARVRQRIGIRAQSVAKPAMPAFAVSLGMAAPAHRVVPRWAAPLVVAIAAAAPAVPSAIAWARLARRDPAAAIKPEKEPVDPGPVHPDVSLDIDNSCRSAFGTPDWWMGKIRRTTAADDFAVRYQLAVVDALFSWADRLEARPDEETSDAVALAERVHGSVATRAAAYFHR